MRPQYYSPPLNRFLVKVIYHQAKVEHIPMTQLTNRLLSESLKGREGWQKAEQECQELREDPAPYHTK